MPPAITVTPAMFQVPFTTWPTASCASGTSGKKFALTMSPVRIGTTPIRISGIIAEMPRILVVLAERKMPPSWMALTANRMTAPSMNTALMRKLRPVLMDPRSSRVSCQVLITESGANRPLRMYPAASAEPVACTGDQANQLHHTETGAMSLLYLHPGDRAVDRGAARLVGKQPGDLGVGEGLNESQGDRSRPDDPRQLADGRGDRADRKQHQRRHAARHPKGPGPVDAAFEPRGFDRNYADRVFDGGAHMAVSGRKTCRELKMTA